MVWGLLGCSVRFLRCCQGGCSGVSRVLLVVARVFN